jgi:hypothetical protein
VVVVVVEVWWWWCGGGVVVIICESQNTSRGYTGPPSEYTPLVFYVFEAIPQQLSSTTIDLQNLQ